MYPIHLRGQVIGERNGVITLEVEGRKLDSKEQRLLEELFPNTLNKIYEEIMPIEAVLGSIVDSSEDCRRTKINVKA